ncbi:MAG: outer membrane beta-barrel protein [Gemmatimonadota bacterium]|nr:outer membrane beta-barrel protein [Gemmatimonadota bacterium]
MRRSFTTVFGAVLIALALAGPATAQLGEGRESARSGLWGGLGFGWGTLGCADCDDRTNGFSGIGIIGGTLSDVVRIGGGGSFFNRTEDDAELEINSGLFIVQVFPGRGNFYLQGGAGFASADLEIFDGKFSDEGAAFQVGVGWTINLGEREKVSIVPYANWTGTSIDFEPEFFQLGVGFFWN